MIARDKQLHFAVGAVIALVFLPFIGWWSMLPVILAGVGKEVWDKQGHGTPDIWDAVFTLLGGLVMCLISWVWFAWR